MDRTQLLTALASIGTFATAVIALLTWLTEKKKARLQAAARAGFLMLERLDKQRRHFGGGKPDRITNGEYWLTLTNVSDVPFNYLEVTLKYEGVKQECYEVVDPNADAENAKVARYFRDGTTYISTLTVGEARTLKYRKPLDQMGLPLQVTPDAEVVFNSIDGLRWRLQDGSLARPAEDGRLQKLLKNTHGMWQ